MKNPADFKIRVKEDDNNLLSLIAKKLGKRIREKAPKGSEHFRISELDVIRGNSLLKVLKELKFYYNIQHARTKLEQHASRAKLLGTIIGKIENKNKTSKRTKTPKLVTIKEMQRFIETLYRDFLRTIDTYKDTLSEEQYEELINDMALLEEFDSIFVKDYGIKLISPRNDAVAESIGHVNTVKEHLDLIIGKLLEDKGEVTEITTDEVVEIYLSSVPSNLSYEMLTQLVLNQLALHE